MYLLYPSNNQHPQQRPAKDSEEFDLVSQTPKRKVFKKKKMAQGITGTLPNFASNNEVLPYLIENRHHLTMMQITHASDWALDPGFLQRDAIAQFILTLPHAQQHQLEEEECLLCCNPYEIDSDAHFPIVLPCGHIFGAACLNESLKDSESCSHCRATIFTRPAAPPHLANPASEEILRGLLESGRVFLEDTMLGSGSDKSYAAFSGWAHGYSTNFQSFIDRTIAKELIRKFEPSLST